MADEERASRLGSNLILEFLAAAERKIDSIYKGISFGSHCIGPDGTYASINDRELYWLKCSREELIGKREPREFLTLDSQSKFDNYMDLHGCHGFSNLELDLLDSHGQPWPILMSFNGTLAKDGRPQKSRFVSFDMAAIQHERKLERIAAVSFGSMCGICITNNSGTILRVNAGFTKLTGYSNQEAVGQNMLLLKSGIHETSFFKAMWQAITSTGYWRGEIRNRRKDGRIITELVDIAAVKNSGDVVTNYVGTFYDITAVKVIQDEITHLAFHDTLTQLPNRRLLQERMEHALEREGRNGLHCSLLFVDLDHFKSINDTLGHEAGDLLLIEVGLRIKAALREGDTVARLGGDEFAVLLEGPGADASDAAIHARQIGGKILKALASPYLIKNSYIPCTASIGISMVNSRESALELLAHADLAMYQAKKHGRNALRFFDPIMQSAATTLAELEQDLRRAIANEEFELQYQPQVDSLACVTGVEALLRWKHPTKGWVSPAEFIPLAEKCGLIALIGNWVLQTACHQLKQWQQHASTSKLTVSVNVSAQQFLKEDFFDVVLSTLKDSNADPALLNLELTERMMIDANRAITKMRALEAVGVKISLVNFGMDYISLRDLTCLPISTLKIDQSLVNSMSVSLADRIIVQTIIVMAKSLGIQVIAMGVETIRQRKQLDSLGCKRYQGYLFSKAQAAQTLTRSYLNAAESLPSMITPPAHFDGQ
ncbi:MAG: putative bifunctional diguanylate cyclase/phosphodiesterase [Burkholderiales bacterium]